MGVKRTHFDLILLFKDFGGLAWWCVVIGRRLVD